MIWKIQNQLDELESAGVISADTAQGIDAYYKAKQNNSSNKLFTAFGILGAVLVGLGIILILAHNWDNFSRTTKTIWAFTPLLIGQLFAGITWFKKLGTAWRETAATFLFFAVGASLALVSQIYNIPGSTSSFLFSWIALTAPIMYLLRSHAAAILHIIFATYYASNLGYFEQIFIGSVTVVPWYYLAMLAWLIPFYYNLVRKDSKGLMQGVYHWLVPLSLTICTGTFITGVSEVGLLIHAGLFGLLYNIGKTPYFDNQLLRTNGYRIIGSIGTVIILLLYTFNAFWEFAAFGYTTVSDQLISAAIYTGLLGLVFYNIGERKIEQTSPFQIASLVFAGIFFMTYVAMDLAMVFANILILALGVYAIYQGNKQNLFSRLNYGFVIIAALIACRFFDSDIDFVLRGLMFVGVGVGFFLANYFMYRKQQKINSYD